MCVFPFFTHQKSYCKNDPVTFKIDLVTFKITSYFLNDQHWRKKGHIKSNQVT